MRAALFALVLGYWTYLLVKPDPVPEAMFDGVTSWFDKAMLHFVLAKLTHFSVYAGFALVGGWVVRPRWRLWLYAGLVLHGAASEVAQFYGNLWYETHRHGCVRDVLIDAAGVLAGAGVRKLGHGFTRMRHGEGQKTNQN